MRELFTRLHVSVRRYSARRNRDAGSVSRYLNGTRVPPWDFVAALLADTTEELGTSPTPEAIFVLKSLHQSALKSSNSPSHAVQILQDQLAEADRDSRTAALERQVITEALQERHRRIADLQLQLSQAEVRRSQQVIELSGELEIHSSRFTTLKTERDRLRLTVKQLQDQLEAARTRHAAAEQRCELLERQLAAIEAQPAATESTPRTPSEILLVDSSKENLLALEAILSPLDQKLISATSGEKALRTLDAITDVALIILSAEMDGMSAFELAKSIKRRPSTRDIPLIFLSSSGPDPHLSFRGYAGGAVDFIVKPFDPWSLRAKVAVFIDLYNRTRTPSETPRILRKRSDAE
ncbi:response regulator [Streptomyces sp. H27-H1]|uniref:response regulator n=1 Tax=Streptomyces sp. H27-H1 TaxID=2996461 RepID=UPI002270FFD0|nr:response regulator [Streptomyces sp. H27-H1]MCY0924844.1 response regulator [Streptomyces sp. H27-H1]